ncbi:kinase-like domain-containing protein [Rhizophagus clarus]|uniref:Kinase-like domain-containing protein n=2 Tax=Rhizophagus clarus TaxID=94130 RepID=A0A8H3LWH8_9GLOM|nr:kinase-like domain-containing protein [Rhizophagus clarus]
MSKNVDWNEWIEDAISKKLIKYYEYKDFSNIQEIGTGGFAKVCRANWKKSHIRYALKSFIKIDNATVKAIASEIQLHREVDHHDNVIRFYGVTTSIKENQRKEYSLVIEYADNGTLRNYLKENFKNLNWDDKYKLAFQLVHAVSCLHDEGIIHRDLHSNNVGHPPFHDCIPYGVGLAIKISQGHRETPISETSKDYIKIYTDCWNIEPDNRPTINQVIDKLKAVIIKENIIIKDFHLYNDNKDIIQSLDNHQPNSDAEILENNYYHENSLQGIDFTKIKEIESLMLSNNQTENDFNIIVSDIVNFLENNSNEIGKQKVLNYLNNQNITLQELNDLLLNNQNNPNYIFLLGEFSYLGIGTDIDKKKAFELYQKAADLGNADGINNLGDCYLDGIGTDIDKKKAFELYQKAADLGDASGIYNLGYCYLDGIGTDIDKKKAFELFQKAADLGNAKGIIGLGYCYQHGIGTDIDRKKAFELYQKAADLGNAKGIIGLGHCYFDGIGTDIDKKKAFELFQKAADLGNASGMNNLGGCYLNGIGTDIDRKKAFELYQKAADLGNALGMNNLGNGYLNGIGTDIDKKKAFELYQKAADLGNASGMNNLGYCYRNGIGTDIDKKKAFELYQKAADLGNTDGICGLGYCYQKGIGTDIDKKKAFELFQKAADLRNSLAQYNLASMYEKGVGIVKDISKAIFWYEKSAEQGDQKAQIVKSLIKYLPLANTTD